MAEYHERDIVEQRPHGRSANDSPASRPDSPAFRSGVTRSGVTVYSLPGDPRWFTADAFEQMCMFNDMGVYEQFIELQAALARMITSTP